MTKIELRTATVNDANFLLDIRNETRVRLASLNSNKIVLGQHLLWLRSNLSSSSCRLFIAFDGEEKVGFVRLDNSDGIWEVSIAVSKEYRGMGYCTRVLQTAVTMNPKTTFMAKIRQSNMASLGCFRRIGFKIRSKKSGVLILTLENR